MTYTPINLTQKLNMFSDHWSPKIIAQMNDYHFKLVKLKGDFVWHRHIDTDEVFLVIQGAMRIDFRDGSVELRAGEMCHVLLVEAAGTVNTGDAGGAMTADNDSWV